MPGGTSLRQKRGEQAYSLRSSDLENAEPVTNAEEEICCVWGRLGTWDVDSYQGFADPKANLFRISAAGTEFKIKQHINGLTAPGQTGTVVWDGAVVMGKLLEHAVERGALNIHNARVIELGAGTGLLGLVISELGAAKTYITDCQRLQPHLRLILDNIALNESRAECHDLDWEDPAVPRELLGCNLVVAADVVYNETVVPILVRTMHSLCTLEDAIVLLHIELRCYEVLECFLHCALEVFTLARLPVDWFHPEFRPKRAVVYVMRRRTES